MKGLTNFLGHVTKYGNQNLPKLYLGHESTISRVRKQCQKQQQKSSARLAAH